MRSRSRVVLFTLAQLFGLAMLSWSLRWPIYDFWMRWRLGERAIPSFETANDPGCSTCGVVAGAAFVFVLSAIPLLHGTKLRRALLVIALTAIEGILLPVFMAGWHAKMFRESRAQVTRLALRSASRQLHIGMTEPEVEHAIAQINLSFIRSEEAGIPLSDTERHLRDYFMARASGVQPQDWQDSAMARVFTRGGLQEEQQIHRYGRIPFRGGMDSWLQEMIEVVYGPNGTLLRASYRTLDHEWNGKELFQCRILWEIPAKATQYPIVSPCRGAKGSPTDFF